MDNVIIFKNEDGSVGVIYPNKSLLVDVIDPDTGDILRPALSLEQMALKDVPAGLSWRIAPVSAVPTDRTFRAAWVDDIDDSVSAEEMENASLGVNMPKAQDIHMGMIRAMRNEKLKELDIEQLKGVDVASQKQMLRDLPDVFDLSAATTVEELKALWPEELPPCV